MARAAEDSDAFYEAGRAAEGKPPPEGSIVVLTFDGKGVVLHRDDLRDAARRAAEQRRQHREPLSSFKRLQPGEKKHAKRMADGSRRQHDGTVRAQPRGVPAEPDAPTAGREAPPVAAPPGGQAGLGELATRALGGGRRGDVGSRAPRPEHVKHWVVLVDTAETQLDLVEAGAVAYGVDVTVILDIIHVVEYVWKAAHAFHREGSPTRRIGPGRECRAFLEGKARRVAAAMRRAATVAGLPSDTRKPVDTCADYLPKYAPYLHYNRYLAAGYPIATGVIEGACRYLIRDRMDLTGARWRLVGAEAGVRA